VTGTNQATAKRDLEDLVRKGLRRQAAEVVERHLEGILGHWKEGLTTAYLEGFNSLFSATKRKARGYRSTEYQIAMLYFVAGKLPIPHYKRRRSKNNTHSTVGAV
jgi:transposase